MGILSYVPYRHQNQVKHAQSSGIQLNFGVTMALVLGAGARLELRGTIVNMYGVCVWCSGLVVLWNLRDVRADVIGF